VEIAAAEWPDGAAQQAEGADTGECRPACDDLPRRLVTGRVGVQRIRCLDDPEILERVLEGLLNLT
jgi:hypothetical protein